MADYIITFDENGQPVIAHAFWNRQNQNGTKKDHKYYEKIKNGLKARYFYSKQEWDAFQRNRSNLPETRSNPLVNEAPILVGKGRDKIRTGKNGSPLNSPETHGKKISGEAKSGIYRRGEGLNSSAPTTGGTGYVPKTKKEKEYAEAVDSLVDYKKKQSEANAVKKRAREGRTEYAKTLGLVALTLYLGDSSLTRQAINLAANTKREMNATNDVLKNTKREQREAAKKFLKETGDFAVEAIKDNLKGKQDQINGFIDKRKGILLSDLDKYFTMK